MFYYGVYKKIVKKSKSGLEDQKLFISNATMENSNMPKSVLVFGDFMDRGELWHIRFLQDNEYVPIYAFEENRGPDDCPKKLSGLGGNIKCYHEVFDRSITALWQLHFEFIEDK